MAVPDAAGGRNGQSHAVARTGAGPAIGDTSMRVPTGTDVRRWGLVALALVALGAAARAYLVRAYLPDAPT